MFRISLGVCAPLCVLHVNKSWIRPLTELDHQDGVRRMSSFYNQLDIHKTKS